VFEEVKKWDWYNNDCELILNSVELEILQDDGNVVELTSPTSQHSTSPMTPVAMPNFPQQQERSGGSTTEEGLKKFCSLADVYAEAPIREIAFLTNFGPAIGLVCST